MASPALIRLPNAQSVFVQYDGYPTQIFKALLETVKSGELSEESFTWHFLDLYEGESLDKTNAVIKHGNMCFLENYDYCYTLDAGVLEFEFVSYRSMIQTLDPFFQVMTSTDGSKERVRRILNTLVSELSEYGIRVDTQAGVTKH
ncbi:hypothetical protein K08M3_49670 [Vibrio alginolyticus]|uniref:Uncharacterized protein n=1 Tax=Vibrio alginolyticus TaxID=663 RepID=A0A1W6TL57_VIBAL|nr:hypothetical protein [Vibrio alginolyticus]ARP06477.1 hypothetical protein K04M1_49540 [Vibrio alginolyticus]ARP11582.1 hypothetical protein K04M3_50130 [Vibrio alginolyticus]ARP16663.1 hypothetical protein K04M5_50110 [Vibrio alginolyticus]ARP21682.1 hypothetical protein K05K4_49730 [Vibrio alginolyticus]ARP26763.1 hypothetical protein K06K5_49630 [Vibrio alginolyticus]